MLLPCPRCGELSAKINLHLAQVPETPGNEPEFRCMECDEEFSIELIRAISKYWQHVLEWLKWAPKIPEE